MDQQLEKLNRPQTVKIILELKLIFQNKQTLRVNILEGRDFPYQYYAWIHITFVYRYIMANGHRHNHHRFLLWQLQLTRQLKELWLKVNTRQISSQSKQQISSDIIKDSPKTKTKTPRKSITTHRCYCPLCKTVSVTVKSWSKQTTIVFHCCVSVVVPIQGLDSKILFCFREWSVWKLPSGWAKN